MAINPANNVSLSVDNLDWLTVLLHDARLRTDSLSYDDAAKQFSFSVWIPARDLATYRKVFWRLYLKETPWRRIDIVLTNVDNAKIDVTESVDYYEIYTIDYSEQDATLDILTHYALFIHLNVSKLAGFLNQTSTTSEDWSSKSFVLRFT